MDLHKEGIHQKFRNGSVSSVHSNSLGSCAVTNRSTLIRLISFQRKVKNSWSVDATELLAGSAIQGWIEKAIHRFEVAPGIASPFDWFEQLFPTDGAVF